MFILLQILQYFREQWSTLPPVESAYDDDIHSKTIVLTGSTVGLGFEASVYLAKMAPKLLVATSRDEAKCARTRQAIFERTEASVTAWPLDLDSFDNVGSFADRFAAEGGGALNALVANAGLYVPEYAQTRDGWEVMLQVNYLSTALLSILLLPYLANASTITSASRLVLVSSVGHYLASPFLEDADKWADGVLGTINSREFGSSVTRYNVSKLLEIMFVRELAARLPGLTPVVACTVNPGYCRSDLFRAMVNKWYIRWIYPALQRMFFARSAEEGAKTLVHPVVAGDARSLHGRYLSCCQVAEESNFVFTPQGKAFSAKLWDETITVLSRVDDRVPDIVAKYLRVDA